MNRSSFLLGVLLAGNAVAWTAAWHQRPLAPESAAAIEATSARSPYASERDWMASDIARSIAALARPDEVLDVRGNVQPDGKTVAITIAGREPYRLVVDRSLWTSGTYVPLAAALLKPAAHGTTDAASQDLDVRQPLTNLTVETLLEQNARISAMLTTDVRSAAAHESAAMILAAYAMREHAGRFSDVRPALNRMTAHLAVAAALRGDGSITRDGAFARAILAVLVGLQRDAIAMTDSLQAAPTTAADRAWIRAIRLRATRDWRDPLDPRSATLLEQFEYASAVDGRRGSDHLLDYLDSFEPREVNDWHRIGLTFSFSIEAGHRFTREIVRRELDEATRVLTSLEAAPDDEQALMTAMNQRPASPVRREQGRAVVCVLGWDLWAGFHQRHLLNTLNSTSAHFGNIAATELGEEFTSQAQSRFSRLTLFPFVLRTLTSSLDDYVRSVADGRRVVETHPELVTAAAWNLMTQNRRSKDEAFPFFIEWFNPNVPDGTAFDLDARALLPNCPRPPTPEQARFWAQAGPYDHWTVWSSAYFNSKIRPTYAEVRRDFGPLLDYDYMAVEKVIDYMEMPMAQRIAHARRLCVISSAKCYRLAELLLRDRQEEEAAVVYDRWATTARSRVTVSNKLTWLVRKYEATGRSARAEALARMAAETGSEGGLETLAHLLDRRGRLEEAHQIYEHIAERYGYTRDLGTFMLRQALRTGDHALELRAWDMLRAEFPDGMQRAGLYALDRTPIDGVVFGAFGRRAAATGLRQSDVIIGIDGWRVRNFAQFAVVTRLRHDDRMTFVVWRDGRFQELHATVPERWFGLPIVDYRGTLGHPPK